MKTGLITINRAIAILEKAKAIQGGGCRIRIYDYDGEVIEPKSTSEGSTMRGNYYFKWVEFSENEAP